YLTVPVPAPPTTEQGITFEYWYILNAGAGADQPRGIFDTRGTAGANANVRNNCEVKDTAPGIEWWLDAPYLPFLGGTGSTVQHHVVVARGFHTLDLYVNGQF